MINDALNERVIFFTLYKKNFNR